jgi:hypothetical protein
MSERQRELAARREALRGEAALQREFLGRAVQDVESRLVGLDRGIDIVRRVASKPVVLAGGIALIALIGPRRLLSVAGKSAMLFATGRRVMRMLAPVAAAQLAKLTKSESGVR